MRVDIDKITSTINKISDMTSGDKIIPGVMLNLSENKLDVCYADNNKSFIETLDVETNETDMIGSSVVVDFSQIHRAINNCQPSGIIRVSDVYFTYNEKTITISAEQSFELKDSEGNTTENKKMGKKSMDITWVKPDSSMKTAVLSRMNYASIFESDGVPDEFDKDELINALSKTSVEKGRQVYLSTKTQTIFVANQAYLTAVPISGFSISQDELDSIRGELSEKGTLTDEYYREAVLERTNRMHYAVCINQSISKALIGILSKTNTDKVYMHTKDKFCNVYIDNGDERVGIWFAMAQASRAHIGTLERYSALNYSTYQVNFLTDFLADSIKSALNTTKSEKVAIKFVSDDSEISMLIACGSSVASISDTYKVTVENAYFSADNSLVGKEFNISLKIFADMLSQIKTNKTALDFDCSNDSTCIRLSEIDIDKMGTAYQEMRKLTEERCLEAGETFDPNSTPTPLDIRMGLRSKVLLAKQYTILVK